LFLTALLAVSGSLFSSAKAEDAVRIVILPVVVHRADDNSRYVSRGIAEMLSSRLSQTGNISVVRIENPKVATTDLELAQKAAREVDGDYVIFGSFTQFGEGASLDIQCAEVENERAGAMRRVFIQSGTMGEIIPKIDTLVAKISVYLQEGGAIGEAPVLAAATAEGNTVDEPEEIYELRSRIEALERAVYDAEVVEDASAATADVPEEGLPES
jgi:TolB-like protein